jgi:hypothetical protein
VRQGAIDDLRRDRVAHRFRSLGARQRAEELVASQQEQICSERRYILATLAKRRGALASLHTYDRSGAYAGSNFLLLVHAKATSDAAERDARFQLRWYFANRQLLATSKG